MASIEASHSNAHILQTYNIAISSLKKTALNVDIVDDTIADMKEVIREINYNVQL